MENNITSRLRDSLTRDITHSKEPDATKSSIWTSSLDRPRESGAPLQWGSSGMLPTIIGSSGTPIMAKARDGGVQGNDDPISIRESLGTGSALDTQTSTRMSRALGGDFSHVRIHTDGHAARTSDRMNARAFTVGEHVAFGPGEYRPGTPIGDGLIAHELSHVLQQRGALTAASGPGSDALEADAERSTAGAMARIYGGSPGASGGSGLGARTSPMMTNGLTLQRCSGKDRARAPQQADATVDQRTVYEKKLNEAVDLLRNVPFGRAVGEKIGDWKSSGVRDRVGYDATYWEEKDDRSSGGDARLQLKSGKKPSEAMEAMFDHLEKWTVDCAEFIQVAQLYALMHAFGTEAFDKRVTENGTLFFVIRPHNSSGIGRKELYSRATPSASFVKSSTGTIDSRSADDVLKNAPIGARVMWTNLSVADVNDAFHNENTIKLGPDTFAAQGFGSKKRFTRHEIEKEMAVYSHTSTSSDPYDKNHVFIAEIEIYNTP